MINMIDWKTIGVKESTLERIRELKYDFRVDSLDAAIEALIKEHDHKVSK